MSGGRTKDKADPTDARFGTVATFERLQRLEPREAKFPFIDDEDVVARAAAAKRALNAAEEARRKRIDRLLPLVKDMGEGGSVLEQAAALLDSPDPAVDAARAESDAAQQALAAATSHILFRAVGRPRYDELIGEHPPTMEQKERMGLDLDHNPQTFPLALIAECSYEPKLTVEQIEELLDSNVFNGADVQAMFNVCILICTTRRTASLGKG